MTQHTIPPVTHTPSIPPAPARSRAGVTGLEPGWTVEDSVDLYNIRLWGKGFFDANAKGNVVVRPGKVPGTEIDLMEVVEGLRERGLCTPVLVHFSDLLQRRLLDMHEAFNTAIK
ncbi:MAG: hypothetical protein RJA12_967, partial [Planctomycetota bacterium]